MVFGAGIQDGVHAAILIAIAAAFSNLMLGASWGSCIDIGGAQTGLIGGVMNTAGQIGGILSPVILALILKHFSSWSAPLYLTATLIAFASPLASVALFGAIALFYLIESSLFGRATPETG